MLKSTCFWIKNWIW